jgi:16S rRNA (uracil1498-N3)-methyltransferase
MKALYVAETVLKIGQLLDIKDEDYHHLVVVSRMNKTEMLLLLNGSGTGYLARVLEITKKALKVEIVESRVSSNHPRHSVMILIPKKDSLDLMIKACVELAVKEVILVRGDHSVERVPETKKLEKMVKQAIEQSNSFHDHKLKQANLREFNFSLYESVNILDLLAPEGRAKGKVGSSELLVVGPEGGFSDAERSFFQTIPNVKYISLETNILRAPTALIAGLGWLYAKN